MSNLINKKFGNLTVISLNHINKYKKFFNCKCDCGNESIVIIDKLNSGSTKSCGCLKNNINKNHSSWRGYGEISKTFWSRVYNHAMDRNLEFKINIEFAWNLFLKQGGKCALSGMSLSFNNIRKSNIGTASLDRIDSSLGYIEGNVQWVHKDINWMKNDFNQEYFIQLCKNITNNIK